MCIASSSGIQFMWLSDSLFLSRILAILFSNLSKEIYLHGSSDVKFYIATFRKKSIIRKTSFLNHESPCLTLKIFKLLNEREERSNNIEKNISNFSSYFSSNVRCTFAFTKKKSFRLVGYKVVIYLLAGMLESFLI